MYNKMHQQIDVKDCEGCGGKHAIVRYEKRFQNALGFLHCEIWLILTPSLTDIIPTLDQIKKKSGNQDS